MKAILMLLVVLPACSFGAGQAKLSASHPDGTPYVEYTGPADVDQRLLVKVSQELSKWAAKNKDAALKAALEVAGQQWKRVDFVCTDVGSSDKAAAKIKVGVEYQFGRLHCVVYENLVFAAIDVQQNGEEVEQAYYLTRGEGMHVKASYTFPKGGGFEAGQ